MKHDKTKQNNLETTEADFLPLTNDFVFTEVMKNPFILQGFLSDTLGIQIENILDIQVLDRHLGRGYKEGKLGILDVRVHVKNVGKINIELQMLRYEDWESRSVFYTSKMLTKDVKKGKDYIQCQKVIQISILGFNLCKDTDYFYSSVATSSNMSWLLH